MAKKKATEEKKRIDPNVEGLHAEVVEQYTAAKERGEIYRGVITREIGTKKNRRKVRQVFEVTKVRSKNGVYLLEPEDAG